MSEAPVTPLAFAAWARDAKPGESLVYFTGFLARSPDTADLAHKAYELQKAGIVHLLQKRLGEGAYAYIAQRSVSGETATASQAAPRRAAALRPLRVNGEASPRSGRSGGELEALNVMERQLKRDLAEARDGLAKAAPGTSAHASLATFADQCERALRFIGSQRV